MMSIGTLGGGKLYYLILNDVNGDFDKLITVYFVLCVPFGPVDYS